MKETVDKLRNQAISFITEAITKAGLAQDGYEVMISNINYSIDWIYWKPVVGSLYQGSINWQDFPENADGWSAQVSKLAEELDMRYGEAVRCADKITQLQNEILESEAGQELAAMGFNVPFWLGDVTLQSIKRLK